MELFKDYGNEGEDDLIQKLESFEDGVIWGTDWTTETITNQLYRKNIDLFPKFQRRDAWSKTTKSRFIESLILGIPVPPIILAEKKKERGKYIVIDGKQRLLTIRQFLSKGEDDEFQPLKLSGLEILESLNKKTFTDIKNDANLNQIVNQLYNNTIRTTVIKNWPNEEFLFTVFLRLNTGSTKLSPQELRQALHPGSFIDFADEFSIESDSIKKMLKISKPDYRMRDVEIVIRYFNLKMFLGEYSGNLKKAFDNTVKVLNDSWEKQENEIKKLSTQLNNSIEFTIEVFGKRDAFSKWNGESFQGNFNRAIFDIMSYYFSNSDIRNALSTKKVEVKDEFIRLCNDDADFLSSFEHTTKSIPNTIKRLETWGESLAKILSTKIIIPNHDQNQIKLKHSDNG